MSNGRARSVTRVGPDRSRVLRCLAMAEELAGRGARTTLVCEGDVDAWVEGQIRARGLDLVTAARGGDHHEVLDRLGAAAVVFDSASLSDDELAATRESGRVSLVIADGPQARNGADVIVAPGVDAEDQRPQASADTTVLAGLDYALMRNDVLANRPISAPRKPAVETPGVTAVFADADVATAGPTVARVLAATGRPFAAAFVTADPEGAAAVEAVRLAPRQRIDVVEPGMRLHERLARSDLVLAAAGPDAVEYLCLGAAVGLVWTHERQVETYRRLMVRRVVLGLGGVPDLSDDPESGMEKATRLLGDPQERQRLADAGWRTVDGLGRARVADVLTGLVDARRTRP